MSDIQQVPNALLGIDVSHYQGVVDWAKVAASGVKFAFIKATDGLTADPMLKANIVGAHSAAIPFGLYHFWRPQDPASEQAANFLQSVAVAQSTLARDAVEFAAALDIEVGSLDEAHQEDAFAWLSQVDQSMPYQGKPIVYVSPSYAKFNLTDPAWIEYPLWSAHYTELMQPNTDKWPSWMFWQRQGNGSVSGITGPCDIDWYNGNEADLAKLINASSTT
jgi:lysozyme